MQVLLHALIGNYDRPKTDKREFILSIGCVLSDHYNELKVDKINLSTWILFATCMYICLCVYCIYLCNNVTFVVLKRFDLDGPGHSGVELHPLNLRNGFADLGELLVAIASKKKKQ